MYTGLVINHFNSLDKGSANHPRSRSGQHTVSSCCFLCLLSCCKGRVENRNKDHYITVKSKIFILWTLTEMLLTPLTDSFKVRRLALLCFVRKVPDTRMVMLTCLRGRPRDFCLGLSFLTVTLGKSQPLSASWGYVTESTSLGC